MATKGVCTLGTKGFVTDPISKIDMLLSHFFLSLDNQTQMFRGTIASMSKIMEENSGDLELTMISLQSKFRAYIEPFFSSVDVKVDDVSDNFGSGRGEIRMTIKITDQSGTTAFNKAIVFNDMQFQKVVDILNDG